MAAVAAAKENPLAGSPTKFLAVKNSFAVQIEMGDAINLYVRAENPTSEWLRCCGDPLIECSKKAKSVVSETCPSTLVLRFRTSNWAVDECSGKISGLERTRSLYQLRGMQSWTLANKRLMSKTTQLINSVIPQKQSHIEIESIS